VWLASKTGCVAHRVRLRLLRPLFPGEQSTTGVYALVSVRKGTILRASLLHDFAQELVDPESRVLYEVHVELLPCA